MKKVIALIRTSTDKQEVESQRNEVISLILSDNYKEDEIEVVGGAGASAIKLDDQYLKNLNRVYELINTGNIESVYAWGIDRIGRNEEVLMKFKNTLINNKVQLVIKNPSLKLLNSDGTVNAGVELAFSLFATMAKQEMEIKKDRFRRGKRKNAEAGKFNGGTLPFGYSLDEQGYYIPDVEQSAVVRLAFELMASDKFTVATLTEELRSRGIIYNDRLITYQYVAFMLKNTAYIGYRNKYAFEKKYPRLISDELFAKVQGVMKNNNSTKCKATKHYNFASLLVKCPVCGRNYIAHHGKYVCSAFNSPSIRRAMGQTECSNNLMINVGHLDGVLWAITLRLHHKHLQGLDAAEKVRITEEIALIEKKVAEAHKRLAELAEKLERIEDIYIETGKKERYETGKKKIENERNVINNSISKYNEEKSSLEALLSTKPDKLDKWSNDNFIISQLKYESTEKDMYELVHKYISAVKISRCEMPDVICDTHIIVNGQALKKDYKLSGRRAVKITVTAYDQTVVELFYIPNFRWASVKCFSVEDGCATPFDYEPIIREMGVITTEPTRRSAALIKTIEKVINTKDKKTFFSTELPEIIKTYGADYSGNFDEEVDKNMKELKTAYHNLTSLRDYMLTLNTLTAASKYFDVSIDIDKILTYMRL